MRRLLLTLLSLILPFQSAFAQFHGRPGQGGGERRPDRGEPPRREIPRQQPPQREIPRREPPRQEPPRREIPRQEPPRRDWPPRQDPPRQQPPRQEPPRQQPPRQEPPRQQPPRQEPPRQQPPRQEPPRQEPPRQQPPRQEPPRRDWPPRHEPPRQQPPRQDPPRQEPPRQEPPRQQPPRQEPPRQRPPRQEPPRQGPGRPQRPPVVVPRNPDRGRVIPRPAPIREPGRIIDHDRSRSVIRHPSIGWDGRPITQQPWNHSPRHDHITIINNTTVIQNIQYYNRYETMPGRYYWHEYGGYRYSHYYDSWGFHWYGWYIGSSYFWVRYYEDRYWWYDPGYGRWCYYHNGYWWWQDPARVTFVYVYVNDRYYRYEDAQGGAVLKPEPPKPADPAQPAPPEQPAEEPTFYSADGTRLVEILGDRKEAFLYDAAGEDPAFLAYLGDSVADVQFSDTTDGSPLMINTVVEKKTTDPDGTERVTRSFKMFDGDGAPIGLGSTRDELDAPSLRQLQSDEKGW